VVKMAGNSGKESSGSVFGGRSSGVTRTSSIVSGGGGGGGIISGTLRNWGRSKSLTDSSNAKNERQSKGILGSATAAAVVAVTVGTAPVPERTEADNYSDNDDDNDNKSNNSSSSASSSSGSSSGSSSRGSSRSGRNNLPGAVKPSITRSSSARLKQPPPNSKLTPRSLAQKSRDSASFSQSKDSIGSSSSSSSSTSSGKNSRSQNRSQSPRHRNLRTSSEVTNSNTTRKLPPPPKRMTSLRKRTNQKVQSQPLKRGPSFNTGGPFRTVR
jgi:translation initiation factor IF-2